MSRWESATNEAAAAQRSVSLVTMVDLQIPGDRLTAHDGIGSFTWGGLTWDGLGRYGSIDAIVETTDVIAAPVEMTLSGVDAGLIDAGMDTAYHGQPARVYIAMFDAEAGTLVDSPELLGEGRRDFMQYDIAEGQASIKVRCEHRLRRMPVTARYTDEDQRARFPTDKFFSRLYLVNGYISQWADKDAAYASGGGKWVGTKTGPRRIVG